MSFKNLDMFRLEDRVLFDAAGAIDAVEAAEAAEANPNANVSETEKQAQEEKNAVKNAPPENPAEQAVRNDGGQTMPDEISDVNAKVEQLIQGEIPMVDSDAGTDALDVVPPELSVPDADSGKLVDAILTDSDSTISTDRELVVINGSVPDKEAILAELKPNQDVLILDDGSGLDKLNEYLDEHADVKYGAIHFVTHGNDGYFTVNGERVDAEHFDKAEWAEIGEHLTDDGDILLYGCNLAENAEGKLLADRIASASGADVAASIDKTGLHGDWVLEYNSGAIETASLAVDDFSCDLTSYTVTSAADSGTGTLRNTMYLVSRGDEIVFDIDGTDTINLTTYLTPVKGITIDGTNAGTGENGIAGDSKITIDGGDYYSIWSHGDLTLRNLNFTRGELLFDKNGSILIDSCSFFENHNHIAIEFRNGENISAVITNSTFTKNERGAISANGYSAANVELTIANSTFTQNSGPYATVGVGNIVMLAISDSTFTKNTSTYGGGAVSVSDSNLSLDNVTFTENSTARNGGSIRYLLEKAGTRTFTCTDVTIDKSYAGGNGGGIYCQGNVSLTLDSTVSITNSTAKENGGGIYFSGYKYNSSPGTAKLTLDGLTATGNKAGFDESGTAVTNKGFGGFLYMCDKANLVMDNVTLSKNTANMDGGAVYLSGSGEQTITGSTFTENTAGKQGGAISSMNLVTGLTVTGSTFTQNSAGYFGGAINSQYTSLRVNDVTFTSNSAQEDGGSIYFFAFDVEDKFACTDVTIDKSYAGYCGGGIYCAVLNDLTLNSTVSITNSTAKSFGGGIYFSDYLGLTRTLTLTGLTATGNKAGFDELGAAVANKGWGGFLYLTNGTSGRGTAKLVMNNVTLSDNTANVNGGAVCVVDSGVVEVTVNDSTFEYNAAHGYYGGAFYLQSTGAGVTLKMDAVKMSGNVAPSSGGAVYVRGYTASTITVTDADGTMNNVFVENKTLSGSSVGQGGGVFCLESDTGNGTVNLDSVTFKKNTVKGYGSGVLLLANRIAEINVTAPNRVVNEFTENTANQSGLLYARSFENSASITVDQSAFKENTTAYMSGACLFTMTNSTEGSITCTNTTFTDNTAKSGGGVITMASTSGDLRILLDKVTMTGNKALGRAGGAIVATTGGYGRVALTIRNDSKITGNSAEYERGGFAALTANSGAIDVTVADSKITDNLTSGKNGGGAFFLYGINTLADITLTMTNSELSGNTAKILSGSGVAENGAGVRILATKSSAVVRLINTTVVNNKADGDGGAFSVEAKNVSFSTEKSKFTDNAAGGDGGAVNIKANATIGDVQVTLNNTNGTLNSADDNGGMLSVQSAHSVTTTVQGDLSAGKTGYKLNRAQSGGAFYFAPGADTYDLTFTDTTLGNGSAAQNGGLIYLDSTGAASAALTVSDAVLRDSTAVASGGAIYAAGTVSNVSIIRSTVSENKAIANGGAVFQTGGTLTIRGDAVTKATVSGNSSEFNGGALYLINTELNTSDAVFSTNKADSNGGTIYFSSGNTVTVGDNVTFTGGSAGGNGGAICSMQSNFSITLHKTDSILDSSAQGHGGAIYAKGNNVTVSLLNGFIATGNKAGYDAAAGTFNTGGNGGMLYLSDNGAADDELNLTIDIARLQNNQAGNDGGAIYVNLPDGVMNSTIHSEDITGNSAVNGNGGALYLLADNRTKINFSRSNLLSNTAAKNGGAVYLDGGIIFTLTDSVIKGNEAGRQGGAIYVKNGFATISKTNITQNTAGNDGGAFMVDTAGKLQLEYSTAAHNTAATGWGGAVRNDGDLTVFNTTIAENNASLGGGIYTLTGADIVDSTIACNFSTGTGGIRNTSTVENSLRILNSLIYSNKLVSLLPGSTDSDIDSNSKFLMGYTTYNTNTIAVSDFNLLAHANNNGIADNTLKVFTLPVGAVATTLPTLVVQNKREVYIPAKWDDKPANKHTLVADRGTMVALKDGVFYYMDATANTDNTVNLNEFYSLDTFVQTAMTEGDLVRGDEVGQNRLKNSDGFTMGAYTLPVQSMIVTTPYDIDDPWDDVISLREAFINAREYYAVTGDIPEIGFDIDASYELEDHPGIFNGNGPVVLQLALDMTGTGSFGYTVRAVDLDFAFTLDGTNFNFQTGEIRGGTDASEVIISTGYTPADTVLKIVDTNPLFADKDVTIQDVTITNGNTFPDRAGGISFNRSAGTLTIDRVSLDRNEGIAALNVISAAQLNMFNTLVTDNSGTGVLSAATANLFVNNTIMNNAANGISVTGTTEIHNSIIAGNGVDQIAGTATVSYSAVEGGHVGTNNVELEKVGDYQYVVKGLVTLATVTADFTGGTGTAAQRYTLAADSYLINRGNNASVVSTYYNAGVMEALDRLGVKDMNPLELSYRIQYGFADMGALESAEKGVFYLNKFEEAEITIKYGEIGTYTLLSDVPAATVTISPLLSQYITNLGGGNLQAIWAMNNPVGGTTAPLAMTSVVDSNYWTAVGDDANYTATLNVTTEKRSLTVKGGDNVVKEYDGNEHKTSYTFTTAFAFSDFESSVTVTQGTNVRRDADNNVVAYDAVLKVNTILNSSLTDVTGNYDIEYDTPATLTITPRAVKITTDSATKVYDGTALTEAGVTVTGAFLAGQGFSDVHTTGSRTAAGVDDNTAVYTYNESTNGANYEITFDLGTLTVTKANLTIGFDANDKVYDGVTDASRNGDFTYTGLISGDDVSLDDSTMSYAFDTKHVGTSKTVTANGYDISLLIGADAGNYDVTFVDTAHADVTKANLTIGFDANNKVYDGTTDAVRGGFTYTGLISGDDVSLDDSTMSYAFDTRNAGTGKTVTATGYSAADLSGADLGNYDVTFSNTALADITKANLTIGFDANDRVYDGTSDASRSGDFTYTGLVSGDDVSLDDSTMSYSFDTKNAGTGKTVTAAGYSAADLSGADLGNYDVTFSNTALADITKRDVTITANSATKEYNGVALTDGGNSLSGSGFVTGEGLDAVKVIGSQLFLGSSDNVVDSYTLAAGTDAGNYEITTVKGTLTITNNTKIDLTVTADSDTKMYDGTALTGSGSTYTGTLATGDVLTVTTSGSQTNAGTGVNNIDTITIMHGSTDVTGYYDVTGIAGSLKVTKRDVTITTGSAEKYYDGTPLTDHTYSISGSGFAVGEGFSNVAFSGSQTNVGSSPNTISGYQFSLGTSAGNYDITLITGTLTVTPAFYNGQNCYQDASTEFYCVDGVMPYTRQMPGGTDYLQVNSPENGSPLNNERMSSMVRDGEFSISDAVEQTPDFVSRPPEQDFEGLTIRGAFDSGKATGELEFMRQPVKMLRSFFIDDDMPGESLLPDASEYDISGLPSVDLPQKNYMFKSDIERMLDEMLVTA